MSLDLDSCSAFRGDACCSKYTWYTKDRNPHNSVFSVLHDGSAFLGFYFFLDCCCSKAKITDVGGRNPDDQ